MLDIIGDTSELSVEKQVAHLNSIISAVLPLGYPMTVLNGGHVAINTDTHGDFFSLLSSLVECGAVIINENDFMYYDTLNNSYLTQEEFDKLNIDANAEHSGFCVFPKPYPNPKFKAKYYHLGDIGDRGPENVMSFAFLHNLLERYEKERGVGKSPVHLALGNHESKDCGCGVNANGAKSHPLYLPILTKMIFKNYIKTGYVLGAADCTIALWHARYLTESLPMIFEDLKDLFSGVYTSKHSQYLKGNIRLLESIKREFLTENIGLYNKLNSFFRKNELSIENILKTFSPSELANLKIILGDGILKSNIDDYGNLIPGFTITDSIAIGTNESGSEKFFLNFPSVRGNINPLFWCDEKCLGDPVIEQAVGHDTHERKLSRKEVLGKKIVDFDVTRSCGFYSFVVNNKYAGRSLSSTFYYQSDIYGNFDPSELSTYTAYTLFREMPDSKDMLPSVDKRKKCFFRNRIGLDGVKNIGRKFENIATAYNSSEVERIIIEYNNREKILNGEGEPQYAACSLCIPKLFKGIDYNELSTNAMDKEEKSLDGIAMSCALTSIEPLKLLSMRHHIDFAAVGKKLERIFNITYKNILRENLYRNNGKDMEKTIDCAKASILKIKMCINLVAVKLEGRAPEVFDTILKVCEDTYGKYNIDHRLPYNEKAIIVSMANSTVMDYIENLTRIINNSRPKNIDKTIDKIINSGIKYIPDASLNNRHGSMAI